MLKNRPFWITLALLASYLLAGYFAGPYFLQPRLKEFVSNELGRELDYASLRFDPITLSINMQQVSLPAKEHSLWPEVSMQADEVHVRFNFWRLGPGVSELLVVKPVVAVEAYAVQPYPFADKWREWRAGTNRTALADSVPVARWRLQSGRLVSPAEPANTIPQVMLDDLHWRAGKVDSAGVRDFSLATTLAGATRLQAQGKLNRAGFSATGSFSAAGTGTGLAGDLEGSFTAGLGVADLDLRLSDSRYRSGQHSLCWDQRFICAQFRPVDAGFEASVLAGTNGLRWQTIKAELGPFELGLSLGQNRVALGNPRAFSGGMFELLRSPNTVEVGSVKFEVPDFQLGLEADGELQLSAQGIFEGFREQAELRFQLAGVENLQGDFRSRKITAQQSQPIFSQLELSLEDARASLAQEFFRQHLPGDVVAEKLGLQMLANQDDSGLELTAVISLDQVKLNPGTADENVAGLDPEWLLAMLQDPQGNVELELPQLAVDPSQPARLSQLLEPAILEQLQENSQHPFSYLAAQSGAVDLELDEVVFAAGSAATHAQSNQVINALGTALTLRPGLSLEVPAVYDPLIDRKALQTEQVRTHIALAGAAEPSFQSGAEPTDFSDAVVHSVIDEFARQRLPAAVLAGFFEHFGEADVDQGIAPEGDAEAYYAALFELLVDYADIPQGALGTLAKYRAQAVIDGLARQGVSRQRLITTTEAEVSEARVDGVPVSLKLEVWPGPGEESPTSERDVGPWE